MLFITFIKEPKAILITSSPKVFDVVNSFRNVSSIITIRFTFDVAGEHDTLRPSEK